MLINGRLEICRLSKFMRVIVKQLLFENFNFTLLKFLPGALAWKTRTHTFNRENLKRRTFISHGMRTNQKYKS